jgi:hypothetical protein
MTSTIPVKTSSMDTTTIQTRKKLLTKLDDTVQTLTKILEKGPVDLGKGAEMHLGVSETILRRAALRMREEGDYNLYYVPKKISDGVSVTTRILTPLGWSYVDVIQRWDEIQKITQPVLNISISEARAMVTIAKVQYREARVKLVKALHIAGYTQVAISKELKLSNSTVRKMLEE